MLAITLPMTIVRNLEKTYHVSQIAQHQLRTAVGLFLSGVDYASVITLAGASGEILSGILLKKGKQPFSETARHIYHSIHGEMPRKKSYKHKIHKSFGISHLKHMGKGDEEFIEIDLEDCALKSLIASMGDYVKLNGSQEQFVIKFYNWIWTNYDGPEIMAQYEQLKSVLKQ